MTCIVCAAWFPFSVHILNGITSINLIFIHCSVPTQCPILCTVPHSLSTYTLSSSHISLMMVVPGIVPGCWCVGHGSVYSGVKSLAPGLRSHSGSFTVTLATGHSLAPARDTRGHQHQATGTLAWPGMAGLYPTDCY